MGERLKVTKSLIDPVYPQAEANVPVELGTAPIRFSDGGKSQEAMARVVLRFVPKVRLVFSVPEGGVDASVGFGFGIGEGWDGKLQLPDRNVNLDMFFAGSGDDHGALAFEPKTSVVNVTAPVENLSRAVFHLFNYPDFSGPDDYIISLEPPHGRMRRCGRAALAMPGWRITIAATSETEGLCKQLGHQGGFALTHMGEIEKDDGSTFSSKELSDLLHCLHCFLSFASGRWAGLALPIGYDVAGNKVFEQWGMPMAASGPWNGSCSWFDAHHGEFLSEVFPGFVALWKDPCCHRLVSEGLYWYMGANDRRTGIGVDTGLIIAQTGLELLAWIYCVQHRKMVSAAAFEPRGLSAADKLRLLVSALDIPSELPTSLSALSAKPGKKWEDGLDAITGMRNAIVHPHAKVQLPKYSDYEAWKLSLWYVDMVLLRLCGHVGRYANRLHAERWVGDVEPVPWAPKAPDSNQPATGT